MIQELDVVQLCETLMENDGERWKSMENDEKRWEMMRNDERAMKNDEKRWKSDDKFPKTYWHGRGKTLIGLKFHKRGRGAIWEKLRNIPAFCGSPYDIYHIGRVGVSLKYM